MSSGAWSGDLRFDLLSTVAYFGINVNPDGILVTGDAGYTVWRSSQMTALINQAHSAGDRVALTVKAFNDSTIRSSTGSEPARQTLINGIIGELTGRGGDGVNIDFEGVCPCLSANFTTFIAELSGAMQSRTPSSDYLTADVYASTPLGGTMYDIPGLAPHLDAFDVMGYGYTSSAAANAGPVAPLTGDWYNDTRAVNDFLAQVPPDKIILGVPYYGIKWSVANNGPEAPTTSTATEETFADALADFGCAQQLAQHWDANYFESYATWWSPASGDPCGGNRNSWRELYFENAASLGYKYDLVNAKGLRGIGIWALGYDHGSNALWNEISLKFSVTHGCQPSAATAQQIVFWRNAHGGLSEMWYADNCWNGPVDWTQQLHGAALASAPNVAITTSGQQLVFWQGVDDHLWEAWYDHGWHGPVDWSPQLGGTRLASSPSVSLTPSGQQLVFWRSGDGHLHEAWFDGHWNGPVDWSSVLVGTALESAPSTAVTANGQQLVFWEGSGGHLFEAWFDGQWNGPVDWTREFGGGSLFSAPAVAVTPAGRQLVFWQGAAGHLVEAWYDGAWNGPVDWSQQFGGGRLFSAPSVTLTAAGQQLVFWQGVLGHLIEAWYDQTWNGPIDWTSYRSWTAQFSNVVLSSSPAVAVTA